MTLQPSRPYRLRMRRGASTWDHTCRTFTTLDKALAAALSNAEGTWEYTRYRVEFEELDHIIARGAIERDAEDRAVLVPTADGAA